MSKEEYVARWRRQWSAMVLFFALRSASGSYGSYAQDPGDSGAPLVLSDNIHCASPVLMDWKTTDWKITGNLETYYFPCDETLGIMASSSTSPATSSSH